MPSCFYCELPAVGYTTDGDKDVLGLCQDHFGWAMSQGWNPVLYEKKTGVVLIAEERVRQMTEHGYFPSKDAQYIDGELAEAAIAYLSATENDTDRTPSGAFGLWPWGFETWKPRSRMENLIRAGALIAAEIDRLLLEGSDG